MSTHPPQRSTDQSDIQPTEETVTDTAPLVFGTFEGRPLPNIFDVDDQIEPR